MSFYASSMRVAALIELFYCYACLLKIELSTVLFLIFLPNNVILFKQSACHQEVTPEVLHKLNVFEPASAS